ncbi:hypothetical protein HNR35_001038 [Borreliella spielmanii]|uniref:Uncharacterized protein n=1 Tax=Borreliella spielmanii TaxID=88916 RepID=A0ABR6P829_9SPIR|nr:hypothetical protein [Borreliella spielmanii]
MQILKRKSNILDYFNENFKKMANHPSSYFFPTFSEISKTFAKAKKNNYSDHNFLKEFNW